MASVHSYYNIMCGLIGKQDIIKEEPVEDTRFKDVKEIVDNLKQILQGYWRI